MTSEQPQVSGEGERPDDKTEVSERMRNSIDFQQSAEIAISGSNAKAAYFASRQSMRDATN